MARTKNTAWRQCARLSSGLRPLILALALAAALPAAAADGFSLTQNRASVHVLHEDRSVKVERIQDPDYELHGYFARTVRDCPPFCLQPMAAAPSVTTVGEVELFDLMEHELRDGRALLIDVRAPSWYGHETLPGAINIPAARFPDTADDARLQQWLELFDIRPRQPPDWLQARLEQWGWIDTADLTAQWDFSHAKRLVILDEGPTSDQAARTIRGLLAAGYPAHRLLYYRGGIQMWKFFGLTTVVPAPPEDAN